MTLDVTGLESMEKGAKEILEHIEAIRKIQRTLQWGNINVTLDIAEAASGN